MDLILGNSTELLPMMRDSSIEGIFTDPPYAISSKDIIGAETALTNLVGRRDIKRDFGEWDKAYNPVFLVGEAERLLVPGGWLCVFTSDKLIPDYIRTIKEHSFHYKATITWVKTNPLPQIRQKSFRSACEYIILAVRQDEKDKDIKPTQWNWLGQANMRNTFSGPLCGKPERLYWHYIGENVYPCLEKCKYCEHDENHRHPTQKPVYVWDWLFDRLTRPGMKVLDPYGGTFSSAISAKKHELDYKGIEANAEYFIAGRKWVTGEWGNTLGTTNGLSQVKLI